MKSKLEKTVVILVAIMALFAFQHASELNYYVAQLDSANMVENIDSTYKYGAPGSQVNKSANDAINTVIKQEASDVCSQPLIASNTEVTKMFERHAYAVLYVLAPFRAVFSGQAIAAFTHAIVFIGLLICIYIYLRYQKLPVIAALVFGLMVTTHPAWSASVLGQFYPDRLFLLAGFVYVILVYQRLRTDNIALKYILITAVLASLIHERAAFMVGGFTLASLFLYRGWNGWSRRDIPLVVIAVSALVYALGYMALFNANSDYGSFSNSLEKFPNTVLNNEVFRSNLEKYLVINLGLLVLAVFEWRLALIAFGAMLPNIIGTIGGAEKTGWSTHYHSTYFPFLVAAASVGFYQLWNIFSTTAIKWLTLAPVIAIATFLALLDPYSTSPLINLKLTNAVNNAWVKVTGLLTNTGEGAGIRFYVDYRRKIAREVPENTVVTTFEGMFPSLLGSGRILHYYPLGLANAEYAVLPFTMDKQGVMLLSGAITYLGSDNSKALDACLTQRIHDENYKIVKVFSPLPDNSVGEVILRREPIQ